MLNAVLHGKAGRVNVDGGTDSISWSELYQQREDLLSAAFFSRFTYLSGLLQHKLLKSWLGTGDFTSFKGIDFWPRYDLPENDHRNFVEPDILLHFEECDVLIEVKPPLGGNQYYEQWRLEIEGYFAQDEDQVQDLYFLAIGRVGGVLDTLDEAAIRHDHAQYQKASVMEWKPIAVQLHKLSLSGDLDAQDSRVVDDMLKALALYDVQARELKWEDLQSYFSQKPLALSALDAWEK